MSATQPCDSPGLASLTARWNGWDEAQPWWESTRSALCGRRPPKAQPRGSAPAQLCCCCLWLLPSRAVKSAVRQKRNLQASRCGELPHFRKQGPKLGNPHQIAVHMHRLSPNRRASPGPTCVEPSFEDPSAGHWPPTLWEISLASFLPWRFMTPPWRRGTLLRKLISANCQACCESGYDFCGSKFCSRIYLEGKCNTQNLLVTALKWTIYCWYWVWVMLFSHSCKAGAIKGVNDDKLVLMKESFRSPH